MKKIFVVGIILLLTCTSTITLGASQNQFETCGKTSNANITISHTPGPGLYWNNHKFHDYPITLYVRDRLGMFPEKIGSTVSGGMIDRVEWWLGPLLQFTAINTGGQSTFSYFIKPVPAMFKPARLGYSTPLTTKVFVFSPDFNESVIWDNFTIYRVF